MVLSIDVFLFFLLFDSITILSNQYQLVVDVCVMDLQMHVNHQIKIRQNLNVYVNTIQLEKAVRNVCLGLNRRNGDQEPSTIHSNANVSFNYYFDKARNYSTYTERRSASENCIIDNTHCIVFSF